MINKT